jgi:hypothetical protein
MSQRKPDAESWQINGLALKQKAMLMQFFVLSPAVPRIVEQNQLVGLAASGGPAAVQA